MNQPAVIQVRLPRSMKDAVARLAKQDGISMNQMITLAVAEKVAVLETMENLKKRAARADYEWFDRFMNREGGEPPREGDELPEGWVRRKW
jgi:hypothetical protein